MILIFSNSSDKSTHQVIEWLVAKKKEYLFINEASPITDIAVEVNNFCTELFLTIDNRRININKIQSVWFRSGSFFSKSNFNTRALPDIFTTHFNFFIKNENAILEEFLFRELSKKCLINNKSDDHINKLTILTIAASIGLTIPVTNVFIKNNELDKEKEYIINP